MWCIAVLSLLGLWYLLAWWSGLDPCTFDGWTNVLTHAAALPAFLAERRLRVQIGLSIAVSVAYHIVAAVDEGSELYDSLAQFDVGMSVALIGYLLLIYMDGIEWAPITFVSVLAASFPDYNVYVAGLLILAGYPVATLVWEASTRDGRVDKAVLVFLQVVSIACYLLGDHYTTLSLHPWWHVTSLLSIYYMVRIHLHEQDQNRTTVKGSVTKQLRF